MYLAASDYNFSLPTTPHPWWEQFLGSATTSTDAGSGNRQWGEEIATVANAILGLREYERNNPPHEKFLPSLMPGGSFNDPDSFLWESRG